MSPRHKDEDKVTIMSSTRDAIIHAAIAEFARNGYEGAKMKHIIDAAGVATGTIYNYFSNKHDLMLAILSEIGEAHCTYITEQVREKQDVRSRLKRVFGAGFEYAKQHPLKSKLLFTNLQGVNQEFRLHLSQTYQPMFMLINNEILMPGIEAGLFEPQDSIKTTLMIMTFYLGVGSTVDEDGNTPLDLEDIAAFVLRAAGAKEE